MIGLQTAILGSQSQRLSAKSLSRRTWLMTTAGASAGIFFLPELTHAQGTALVDALRTMSPVVTGTQLPAEWVEPVAGLVGVILESSRTLRQLDLGDLEPATAFSGN